MVSYYKQPQKVDLNKPLMSKVSAILAAMGFHGRPQVKPKLSKLPMWDGMGFFDKYNMLIIRINKHRYHITRYCLVIMVSIYSLILFKT